jgi:radical SAM protein (TIGR01212 family)
MSYLTFNEYLKNKFGCKVYRIPLNTPCSCPNRIDGKLGCIYCDDFGSGASFYPENVKLIPQQVEYGMELFSVKRKAKKFFVYFQSFTNTYGNINDLEKMYESALIDKKIVGIIIGTRPDCINEDIVRMISIFKKEYDVWVELGLQSSNPETLKWLNRGHTIDDFIRANELCQKYGIKTTAHIIYGLPVERKEDMLNTGNFVIKNNLDGIKIHSLYIIRETQLHKLYLEKKYKLLSMDEYTDLVAETLLKIPDNMVVHRLTGETDSYKIVAPNWVKNKNLVLNEIQKKFFYLTEPKK